MMSQLTIVDLKKALTQEDCALCRLQRKAEERYLGHLLWEYVNDLSARARFLASWGYCARHARMLGRLELRDYHDAMGTAIMYESVIQRLKEHLKKIAEEIAQDQAPKRLRILRIPWVRPKRRSSALASTADCYVCKTGAESAGFALEVLIEAWLGQDPKIPDLYQSSDGLCLPHLRLALSQIHPEKRRVGQVLIEHAQKRMVVLQNHLSEYIRKHGWDFRAERITPEEYASWSKAVAFFSGGLMEEVPRETPETRPEGESGNGARSRWTNLYPDDKAE